MVGVEKEAGSFGVTLRRMWGCRRGKERERRELTPETMAGEAFLVE